MKARTVLFIGGPLDGQWLKMDSYRYVTYVLEPEIFEVADDPIFEDSFKTTWYYLHRWYGHGWTRGITLPFMVHQDLMLLDGTPVLPDGTVMPGHVVGRRLEAWPR